MTLEAPAAAPGEALPSLVDVDVVVVSLVHAAKAATNAAQTRLERSSDPGLIISRSSANSLGKPCRPKSATGGVPETRSAWASWGKSATGSAVERALQERAGSRRASEKSRLLKVILN